MASMLPPDRSEQTVQMVGEDLLSELTRPLHRDAVCDGEAELRCSCKRRASLGLHPDKPDLGTQRAECERDSRREPAPADRHDDCLDVLGELLGELEPERALAGDHHFVLEGVDERRSGLDPLLSRGVRLVEALADEDNLGPVAARGVHLRHGRVLRHEHDCSHACLPRRERDRLPVVPCACRHDSRRALRVGERGNLVDRAADLERAGPLEILGLEEDAPPGKPRKRL